MIIKSISFYHTEKHNPHKPQKSIAIIEETKNGLFKRSTYIATMIGLDQNGEVKRVNLGSKNTRIKEYQNLDELWEKTTHYFTDCYMRIKNNSCYQTISIPERNSQNPLEFRPPTYTPDPTIMHDDPNNPEVQKAIEGIADTLVKAFGNSDLGARIQGIIIEKNGQEIVNTLKKDGSNQKQESGSAITVPLSDLNSSPTGPVPLSFKANPTDSATLNKESDEYKSLCEKYGQKNIDKLIQDMHDKKNLQQR